MNEYKFMVMDECGFAFVNYQQKSARYLQAEIPVRIAHRIRDFQNLPFIVACNPYLIEVVRGFICRSFRLMPQIAKSLPQFIS